MICSSLTITPCIGSKIKPWTCQLKWNKWQQLCNILNCVTAVKKVAMQLHTSIYFRHYNISLWKFFSGSSNKCTSRSSWKFRRLRLEEYLGMFNICYLILVLLRLFTAYFFCTLLESSWFIYFIITCLRYCKRQISEAIRWSVSHQNDGHNPEFITLMYKVVNSWF